MSLAADLAAALDASVLLARSGYAPDPWQAGVLRSSADRVLLNCCRQSGKSTTSAALAVHEAVYTPDALVLLLSPSLRQSQELFRKCLDVYHAGGQAAAPEAESALRLELTSGSRIVSLPGTEGTIRGYSGVRLLIVDEAARVADSLYYAVRPMLAVSGGRLVALSTPNGTRGWWHHEWAEGGAAWERVKITGEQCPRISRQFLEQERATLPPAWFASEYGGEFVEPTDQVFGYELVQAALSADVAPLFGGDHGAVLPRP